MYDVEEMNQLLKLNDFLLRSNPVYELAGRIILCKTRVLSHVHSDCNSCSRVVGGESRSTTQEPTLTHNSVERKHGVAHQSGIRDIPSATRPKFVFCETK